MNNTSFFCDKILYEFIPNYDVQSICENLYETIIDDSFIVCGPWYADIIHFWQSQQGL